MTLLTGQLRRIVLIVFASAMALVAVILVNHYIQQALRRVEEREQALVERERALSEEYKAPVNVVVAAKDLSRETTLDASHLRFAQIPEKFVQPYTVRSFEEVAGKVTVAPIAEGEQVLSNKLRRQEELPTGSTLSTVTPSGKRAVTISVDTLTGVGGFVRPGDGVDVLWTIPLPGVDKQAGQIVTLTLFQDVPVLAVGGEFVGRPSAVPQEGTTSPEQAARDFTVTLALTPQEASFMLFAREQGRIQLSLRPVQDKGSQMVVVPANINTLLQMQAGLEAAAPPPPPVKKAEIYKGLRRDVVELSEGK